MGALITYIHNKKSKKQTNKKGQMPTSGAVSSGEGKAATKGVGGAYDSPCHVLFANIRNV